MHGRIQVRPSRYLRVKASLLLTLFFAAGTSLPSLDAVVYHHQGADAHRWQSHIEAAGGCLDHTQHCGLGRTAPGSSAVAALAGTVRTELVRRSAPQRPPAQPRFDVARIGISQPRAPPAHRA